MKTKSYRIWIFGYQYDDQEQPGTLIKIPEGVKFFCLNPDTTIENSVGYKNLHYISVIPYSKTMETFGEKNINQVGCKIYYINKDYIIWDFEQIFPMSSNWPITEVPFKLKEPIYLMTLLVKYNNIVNNVNFIADTIESCVKEAKELSLSNKELNDNILRKTCPIKDYIKINEIGYGYVDVTIITVGSWIDGSSVQHIRRDNLEYNAVFSRYDSREEILQSSENEYYNALRKILIDMNINKGLEI